jgi:peptidyl-prolyl cis-trans isomerase C
MEWKASHILVQDKALAEAILKRLKEGGSFESLAREFSKCPSKGKGGDLGWFGEGQMVKPFEDAVRKLSKGRISGPVKTQFGFHIIKKTDER